MTSQINGLLVDDQSRCQHYHSSLDHVALKCYQCHDALEDHSFRAYPCQLKQDKVLICGVCRHEMTIEEYQEVRACPNCHSAFNPACSKHYDIYFEK